MSRVSVDFPYENFQSFRFDFQVKSWGNFLMMKTALIDDK